MAEAEMVEDEMMNQGWECPKCGTVWNPNQLHCPPPCSGKKAEEATAWVSWNNAITFTDMEIALDEVAARVLELIQDAGFGDGDDDAPAPVAEG